MITNIINDCKDANAFARQIARAASLLNRPVNLVGINSDLEAAGNIVDLIDAIGDHSGLVIANVAPRHRNAKKWPNGSPFGFFHYKKILILSTVDGLTLSLVKKLNLTQAINVINIPPTLDKMIESGVLTKEVRNHIVDSQFRSFDFLPRVAAHIIEDKDVVSQPLDIAQIVDAPQAVWWVDNFGNCKTTLLEKNVVIPNSHIEMGKLGQIAYFRRLKDVPDGESAVVVGSSGIDDKRFLEIVVQGESASKKFGLLAGDLI